MHEKDRRRNKDAKRPLESREDWPCWKNKKKMEEQAQKQQLYQESLAEK